MQIQSLVLSSFVCTSLIFASETVAQTFASEHVCETGGFSDEDLGRDGLLVGDTVKIWSTYDPDSDPVEAIIQLPNSGFTKAKFFKVWVSWYFGGEWSDGYAYQPLMVNTNSAGHVYIWKNVFMYRDYIYRPNESLNEESYAYFGKLTEITYTFHESQDFLRATVLTQDVSQKHGETVQKSFVFNCVEIN